MNVFVNTVKEIHISELHQTTVENITRLEPIEELPRLFWCKGILFADYDVEELRDKLAEGKLYLESFVFAKCPEKITVSKFNGYSVDVLDLTGNTIYEDLIDSIASLNGITGEIPIERINGRSAKIINFTK